MELRKGTMENMDINSAFWAGRRVFLTGHTGFKGSWLSLWLQELGASVTGFSLPPPTEPSLFHVARVEDKMRSLTGDIRDLEALRTAISSDEPEVIIHMAAQSLVRYSYTNPVETYATNVLGTVHVLEAARQVSSVRAIVNVTSDKCYENKEWVWGYRETEPMGGFDPYSSSKGCSELVTSAYRRSFMHQAKIALASARAGNVIGGGDWSTDRLIPDILRSIEAGKAVPIRSPKSIRPWQHVLEPLRGYLLLAEKLYKVGDNFADGWNFGPSEEDAKPVEWIVNELTQLWGEGAKWEKDSREHPHEAGYLRLDCSKAHALLGWRPRWSLAETLKAIVNWHRSYLNGTDMREYSIEQIRSYIEEN